MRRWGVVAALVIVLGACSGGTPTVYPLPGPASVAARPSAGCGGAARTLAAGETRVTMTSKGVERWYFRHVPPAGGGAKPLPLVLDLHGYTEGAVVHVQMSELGTFGDTHGFVTITPQGLGAVSRWDTDPKSDDVAFMRDLLDDVERGACIDRAREFVTGLSNGAMMTSVLACVLADRIAAVAPVAGASEVSGCRPSRPVTGVAFHGTADPFLPYDGGFGPATAKLPAPDGSGRTLGELRDFTNAPKRPSIPKVMDAWARRNRCTGAAHQTTIAADVTELSYNCPAGADVELYRVQGGGHAWPGSAFSKRIESVVGHTTDSISADQLMWDFFRAHPLREPAA